MQPFRLTNEPGGLGLSCTYAGLSLAGVPLLQKTKVGFAPRPASEVASLIKAAYGAEGDPIRLESSLGAIARALNSGDFARAAIAAVLTRTPELGPEAAARLAKADEELAKYSPDEPRDWHGRWTDGESVGEVNITAPEGAPGQGVHLIGPRFSDPQQDAADRNASPTAAAFSDGDDEGDDDESREPNSPEQEFEQKYDDLGPVDFAKLVIQFGDRLGREGKDLSPEEKELALAEYSFLQDRLSFWLGYEYKPAIAQANLLSAAFTLFQGAVSAGIAGPGRLPNSMVAVAGAAMAFDSAPPRIRPATKPTIEDTPAPQGITSKDVEGLGGTVDNSEVEIDWSKGIKDQGDPFEIYYGEQNPGATRLLPGSKAFDYFDERTGEAVSAKTLNTLSAYYARDPENVYNALSKYIGAVENYSKPRGLTDVDPALIQSKTIHLAIPEYTSPAQWRYLFKAIRYARERGVSFVITRIRE